MKTLFLDRIYTSYLQVMLSKYQYYSTTTMTLVAREWRRDDHLFGSGS